MEIQEQGKLRFNGVNIVRTNFSAKNKFDFEEQIDLDVDVKLVPTTDPVSFQILMDASLSVKNYFKLDVIAIGNFDLEESLQGAERLAFININAPAIMFPYLRAFITNFSASCGETLPKITIPPQFFDGELDLLVPNK